MAETSEKALMRCWSLVLARAVKVKQDVGEGSFQAVGTCGKGHLVCFGCGVNKLRSVVFCGLQQGRVSSVGEAQVLSLAPVKHRSA